MTQISKTYKSLVVEFKELFTLIHQGLQNLQELCEQLVIKIDSSPDGRKAAIEVFNSRERLEIFEKIGRRVFHPLLCFETDRPGPAYAVARLPYEMQEKLAKEPIAVLKLEGDKVIQESKLITELTTKEVQQVFDGRVVRSTVEQKSYLTMQWLEQEKEVKRHQKLLAREDYEITPKGTVKYNIQPEFSLQEALNLVELLKRVNLQHLPSAMKDSQVRPRR